ncbi:MAG: hypothetical protein JSS72_13210 [Armatimonadetes bacterium]|nr:hypothetical protein [Armatimonadota bacterium]
MKPGLSFIAPIRIASPEDGKMVRPNGPLSLSFDASGQRAFSPTYQALLQSVFATAQPTMDAVFGPPSVGGVIHVANYDADIGDRQAVTGGYFVVNNGLGQMEIRLPVYNSPEAAAINFLHCLLLAYLGPDFYSFDGFQEGLVRAATYRIASTPGAMPNTLDPAAIGNVLDASYSVDGYYDWYNQEALAAPTFIAPNLLNVGLPAGGSPGGLYLLRYLMAGSAWQKVLAEYPTFIAGMNQALYANPAMGADVSQLVAAGQTVIDSIKGGGSTIEGLSFAEWWKRQRVLDVNSTYGLKLLVDPIPIINGLSGGDFGVFIIQATAFFTGLDQSETLLSGTSYPIFWDRDFLRVIPSAQDELMGFAGGYASVVPNFADFYGGQPYRLTADVPFQDHLARAYLPAGGVVVPSTGVLNDLFGTISGHELITGEVLSLRVTINGGTPFIVPITNLAFGTLIGSASYDGWASVKLDVLSTINGNTTLLLSRVVDKGPGALGVNLKVNETQTVPLQATKGLNLLGMPIRSFFSDWPTVLGLASDQILAARFNQSIAGYDLYPSLEAPTAGHGYFFRLPANSTINVTGSSEGNTPTTVALRPGWNLVTVPGTVPVPLAQLQVIHATDFPSTYDKAVGTTLGTAIYALTLAPPDPVTGASETGTFNLATDPLQPGQGYYVQVLSPEGASLLFVPGVSASVAQAAKSAQTALSSAVKWKIGVLVQGPDGSSRAEIGASTTATAKFDPKEDAGLPPGIGGFQIYSQPGLYRDMRSSALASSQFTIRLNGLRPGRGYLLSIQSLIGNFKRCRLTDSAAAYSVDLSDGKNYQFVARDGSRDITLTVWGNRN